MKQVTIYDIAKEANVSVATVSRVLNNTAPVKDSTRLKIMGLIDHYQFQPNALARGLSKKETGTIGVIQTANRIPLVLVNGNLPGTSLYRVMTNESKGAEIATQYLIDCGHRDIAFIAGNDNMTTTAQKVRAFKKVMASNGLPVPDTRVLYGDFSMTSGERLMKRFLSEESRPTAVFCVNDFTAVGAVKAAMKAGVRVPDDISIIGFDDIPLASAIYPELTTVKQQMDQLGATALEVLHKLVVKEKVKKVTIIEPELVVRESARRLSADRQAAAATEIE
ncbi:LacI family DNA-binding transcriptional regulator [Paenibacillus sp. PL2-23]|uniref:LacI family DNA-binding transcriptional regulator n=1 Tax=Paenibacillus sp. PL2-23 TaxID=2100729 RepID=UPI0030F51306